MSDRLSRPVRGRACLAFTAALTAVLAVLAGPVAGSASAATFFKGYAAPEFASENAAERDHWFDESVRANANIARINLHWRAVTSGAPMVATNPADPAYQFGLVDEAVRDAASRGQAVLLTVLDAPNFAEGPNRPPGQTEGAWKPDPAALGDFAQAAATRYSGTFPAPGAALPRVNHFEVWNEPNLFDYLSPQSTGNKRVAGDHYRKMVSAFSAGVSRSLNPQAQVIAGATAPYGEDGSQQRTRPLLFLRDFLCLNRKLKPAGCGERADFDIVSHHPITIRNGPRYSAIHPDDVAVADFKNVVKTMRAAERGNTVSGGKHEAWATEFWWETKPPDIEYGVPLAKHARWIQEAMYSLWKHGADAAIWLQLIDHPVGADKIGGNQTGHFFSDGAEKPAFQAFRFPFHPDRVSKRKVNVWTIAPGDGTVEIQVKKGGGFRTVDRMKVRDGVPEQAKVGLRGKAPMRGELAGEASRSSRPG